LFVAELFYVLGCFHIGFLIDADAACHFQWRTDCSFEVVFEMTSPTGRVCRLQVALASLSPEIGCYRDRINNLKTWTAALGGLTLKRVRADTT
jgi:hypothetical protein